MRRNYLLCLAALLLPAAAKSGPGVCLTALAPSPPFVPPAPYDSVRQPDGTFWYGTAELWTDISVEGVWHLTNNSDTDGGYVTKLVFWAKGFDWRKEPNPELILTARRTDGDSPSVAVAHANAVFITGKTPAMMTGIRIPTSGCWEITGHYRSKTLTFTVSVEP
jgi:hypothetical protein